MSFTSVEKESQRKIYLGIFSLSLVVSILSVFLWQKRSQSQLNEHTYKRAEENIIFSNLAVANSTHATIISNVSLAKIVGELFNQLDSERFGKSLESVFENNHSIVSIQIVSMTKSGEATSQFFKLSGNESPEIENQYKSKIGDKIFKAGLMLLQSDVSDVDKFTKLDSSLTKMSIPIYLIARQLDKHQFNQWVILSLWASKMTSGYRQTGTIRNTLVNRSGIDFLNGVGVRDSLDGDERTKSIIKDAINSAGEVQSIHKKLNDGSEVIARAEQIGDFSLFVVTQNPLFGVERDSWNWVLPMLPAVLVILLILVAFSIFIEKYVFSEMTKTAAAIERLSDFGTAGLIEFQGSNLFKFFDEKIYEAQDKIKDYILQNEQVFKVKTRTKLSKDVQQMLTPKSMVNSNGISTYRYYNHGVGQSGDWWSRFSFGDEFELIVLSDANCNSTHASVISSLTYGFFANAERIFLKENNNKKVSLSELIKGLNSALYLAAGGRIHLKLSILAFHLKENRVSVVNAGNHYVYSMFDNSIEPVKSATSVLGLKEEILVEESMIDLHEGHRFCLHTDGLFDCSNGHEEKMNQSAFFEKMKLNFHHGLEVFSKNIYSEVDSHFAGYPLSDDISILIVEVRASPVVDFRSSWDIEESKVVSLADENESLVP